VNACRQVPDENPFYSAADLAVLRQLPNTTASLAFPGQNRQNDHSVVSQPMCTFFRFSAASWRSDTYGCAPGMVMSRIPGARAK
jgi:hypothetical protein